MPYSAFLNALRRCGKKGVVQMKKKSYLAIAAVSFLLALFLIDSPYWLISFAAIAVMGIATFKGRLWQ